MRLPLTISFRNMERSAWAEQVVKRRVGKLLSFCSKIISCRVVIEIPHRHHHQGNFYLIRLHIRVPDKEIVVNREASEHAEYEDFSAAVRDAFDAAKRQLNEYIRCRHGRFKSHQPALHARVVQIFPDQEYGFLQTRDGREVYFHANSVLNEQWPRLSIGSHVAFFEEQGEEGIQASTVKLVQSKEKNVS